MKKSYHNKLKTILHLAITDITKRSHMMQLKTFCKTKKMYYTACFHMIYIYILSAQIFIYKHAYHHHMHLFHNTYTCKIFT